MRVLTVGLGVTLGCIAAGAIAGVLCLVVVGLVMAGPREAFSDAGLFGFAAMTGGFCGLVVGPLAAFGFLRRVLLGRLFVETAIGAILGGLLGAALPIGFEALLVVAVIGFAIAVANLARRYRATPELTERVLAD
jgi:hypothetical protein